MVYSNFLLIKDAWDFKETIMQLGIKKWQKDKTLLLESGTFDQAITARFNQRLRVGINSIFEEIYSELTTLQ